MYTQRLSQLELLQIDSGAVVLLGDSHVAFGEWSEWLPNTTVANRGIPGEGIEGLLAFAKTQRLEVASAVFIQVGTNDLLFHEVDEVVAIYQAMIDEFSEDVEALNSYIASQKKYGKKILDLAARLETQVGVLPEGLTDDGVHLKGQGYRTWAAELMHHINRVVPNR